MCVSVVCPICSIVLYFPDVVLGNYKCNKCGTVFVVLNKQTQNWETDYLKYNRPNSFSDTELGYTFYLVY